jgi:DNA-directed RNA polymerase subunit RPC12/RpoP
MSLLRVKCPACGWVQNTKSRTYVQCFRCGHRYRVFPRRRRSRVVGTYSPEEARRRRMWGSSLAWRYVMGG